jgi:hypothetical protein
MSCYLVTFYHDFDVLSNDFEEIPGVWPADALQGTFLPPEAKGKPALFFGRVLRIGALTQWI